MAVALPTQDSRAVADADSASATASDLASGLSSGLSSGLASDSSSGVSSDLAPDSVAPGFVSRYRLPLLLAVIALMLYLGSILYILIGRGQVA